MQFLRLFRTTTFRLAVIYLLLFLVAVLPVLGFIYWSTATLLERQVDEILSAEVVGLEEIYRGRQLAGLIEVVTARANRGDGALYMLARSDGSALAGNLKSWPVTRSDPHGRLTFNYRQRGVQGKRPARGEYFLLSGGVQLLVGRDVSQMRQVQRLILNALAAALAATIGLGMFGGVVTSRRMMQRLEAITRTSRNIIAGDLTQRVRLKGAGDEIDQLADNLNAMLDQIERLMMGMREVADNIAHDLKTPLTRLRNRIEGALIAPAGRADHASALERALEETDQILKTFNALLSIARLEAGAIATRAEPLDLKDVAGGVIELYEPFAEERQVRLVLDAASPARMRGHSELLSQALANLVDNAIKFSPAGGTIRVRVARRAEPPAVEISVADDGPGIPAADRERVLSRFVRLEASRNTPGSGLGLSLVSAVVHLHEGRLELEAAHREAPHGLLARLVFPAEI
ncbi:MAG: HAMP domain-containing protein [Alphaproteobacteria bacterium]|nr:HAMP domain-containing protein [Alphaproteobacteria bacterium]